MNRAVLLTGLVLTSALAGCTPPPSDTPAAHVSLLMPSEGPSEPLPSPDTTDAIWAEGVNPMRLVYGVPGQPVLLSIACQGAASPAATITITRNAPADKGAEALLALVGKEAIGRFAVDATEQGGRQQWQGSAPAANPGWDAFKGEREATVTVPGAGLVRLNPSPLPMALVETCRGAPTKPEPPVLEPVAPPEVMLSTTP
ncbi:MAG: hypothetical protein NWP98_03530 [Erythrobacter sp.]|nr:hypothetical protein [Erythrobacter sp.]